MPSPCVGVQIVYEVTAPDDQHSLGSERRQPLADLIVKRGRSGLVDAQLDDGDIRRWVRVTQHGPRAMVESPRRIQGDGQRGEQGLNAARKFWVSGRRVLH